LLSNIVFGCCACATPLWARGAGRRMAKGGKTPSFPLKLRRITSVGSIKKREEKRWNLIRIFPLFFFSPSVCRTWVIESPET
jgi:hypothetical protein